MKAVEDEWSAGMKETLFLVVNKRLMSAEREGPRVTAEGMVKDSGEDTAHPHQGPLFPTSHQAPSDLRQCRSLFRPPLDTGPSPAP